MAWLTRDDINYAIGTAVALKVAPTTASFDAAETRARMKVRAAYLYAGYSLDNEHPTELAKHLAIGQWVLDRYGLQKGLVVPDAIADYINMLELVRRGELPDPDATVNTRDGIGGVKFSSTSQLMADGKPPRFSRDELRGW